MRLIAPVICSLFLLGCSKNPSKALGGKWSVKEFNNHSMEFFSDGTYTAGTPEESILGRWTFVEGGRLRLANVSKGTEIATLWLVTEEKDKDQIILRRDNGKSLTLKRK